ncbi:MULTISPECIES: lactonase family protein [Bacteria]|uniref:lactonase family protein n=1 Tax=Bacteria TaxID=2 RepID=UPI001402B871|nr:MULTISPECIES: beta-propeller fold lactonase family protein [Bacteria]
MTRLVVGTYAARGGPGLIPITDDGGDWTVGEPFAAIRNASFGIASPRHGLHYLVDEQAGTLGVYDARRDWTTIADVGTGGAAPCHLALSPDETLLAIAHYESGTIALFDLNAAGRPAARRIFANTGRGPDSERQRGPHAHWVGFTPSGALQCVDLGTDAIVVRDAADRNATRIAYAAPAGSGPRHLAAHPTLPLQYLVSELAATLTVLRPQGQHLIAERIVPTGPQDAETDNLGGGLAITGDRLYVSNRGADTIATFALDDTGTPHRLGDVASGGQSPRFVLPLERHLVVAHEEGGGVAIHALDTEGRPQPDPIRLDIPGAAFVMIDPR